MNAPFEVVVGTTDPAATAAFFGAMGFEEVAPGSLRVPGAASGGIALERAEEPGEPPVPFSLGPSAIDVYTRSIDEASELLAATGASLGKIGELNLGPLNLRQRRVLGPDHLPVVLVETESRRSSILDRDPDRLCSEVHSVVWGVADLDAERQWFVARNCAASPAFGFEAPGVSDLLDLPRSPVPARMCMISDDYVGPIRLELMEFPEDPGRRRPGRPVAGIWGLRSEAMSAPGKLVSPESITIELV